jgi:hypothetical protein
MRPSTPRRERILVYGGPGSSKTRSWLTIAEMYRKTKTPGTFYVLDTDDAYWSNVEEFPALAESGIVVSQYVYDWEGFTEVAKEYKVKAGSDDWIVTDLFDKGWEEVQNYYSEQAFGKDKGNFFLDLKKQLESSNKTKGDSPGFEGWTDWPTIKALHAAWANDVIFKHKAHVYLAATQKPTSRKTDKADIIDTFGHLGAKPGGEKSIGPHGVNTVIKFAQKRTGTWTMDTAKDRGAREQMVSLENKNFAMDYLLNPKRGGWKLK